ncbi:hypothetical protein ACVWXQ_001835 [Bradyrhizobium sp. S3.14.4]
MSHTTKLIAMRLALYINVTSGRCDPAVPTLASGTDASKSTVLRAIREMEAAGWLEVTRSRGGRSIDGIGYTHSFVFLDPNGVSSDTVGEGATVSNEPTYGVKKGGATVSNSPVYGVTVDTQTERTAKRTTRTASGARSRSVIQTGWPDGFSLNNELIAIAAEEGFNQQQAEQIFKGFESKCRAKGTRNANWIHAWRNWVIGEVGYDARSKASETARSTYIDPRL